MMNQGSDAWPVSDARSADVSCAACLGRLGRHFIVHEQMFGTMETFTYGECHDCLSLRLLDVPDDLSGYYPHDYYSMKSHSPYAPARLAKVLRAQLAVRGYPRLAQAVGLGRPFPAWALVLRDLGVSKSARILDVGSGAGQSLQPLRLLGFKNLLGIDAFVASGIYGGIRVDKATLDEVDGRFDVVMMHHALEHVRDPAAVLRTAHQILDPQGHLLVRMPVADCAAWHQYGVHWVSLDAPRHLNVISERGCRLLADSTGFTTAMVLHDSDEFQFWGSEQYRRGISLHDRRSWAVSRRQSPFSWRQINAWRSLANQLNRQGKGDSALYVLKPAL
jgi:SAM-dependent methyltransferase